MNNKSAKLNRDRSNPIADRKSTTARPLPARSNDGRITFDQLNRAEASGDSAAGAHLELFYEMLQLWEIIEPNYPARHIVARLFSLELDSRDNDEIPPLATLQYIKRFFYSLPADEQRRALNGWKPSPARESKAALIKHAVADGQVYRVLNLAISKTEGKSKPIAFDTNELLHLTMAVQVRIVEGTSKHQAIAELESIIDHLRLHFDRIVAGEDTSAYNSVDEEKKLQEIANAARNELAQERAA